MRLIYVGRLEELKGIRVLFEAWKQMGADAPELMIYGSGPLDDWCRENSAGLNIQLKGVVTNSDVKKYIAESQALILPTLCYEGFPMTVLEAFSVGTPVICSDLGNAGAVVDDGITGWKFRAGDPGSLVCAIGRWKDVGDNVKRTYQSKYTAEENYRLSLIHI